VESEKDLKTYQGIDNKLEIILIKFPNSREKEYYYISDATREIIDDILLFMRDSKEENCETKFIELIKYHGFVVKFLFFGEKLQKFGYN
jgi:hypothetical protein